MDSIWTIPTPLLQHLGLQFFHYLLIQNNLVHTQAIPKYFQKELIYLPPFSLLLAAKYIR